MNPSVQEKLTAMLAKFPQLYIKQRKELVEILVDWETANRYVLVGPDQSQLGYIAERKQGILSSILRAIFRSHRAFEVDVFTPDRQRVLTLWRDFFWFFSSLSLRTEDGRRLGQIEHRFGILRKKYDLMDGTGRLFARIESPLWRLWEFPIYDTNGQKLGSISKRWGGLLREMFTDADTYQIDFGSQDWSVDQRAVILAVAISLDFDFFEENQGSKGGLLSRGGSD